ncbi:hypothetical protein BV22DRAFT_1135495 [Leucogyrophana mollusca]|uniref:Uncharacterized protein n=1 Tax=Leucogyrophana mollusca TaxID=85980 RepID=A0ACB8AVD3_9AGAM|nr:hypothetical protein BV22DRAFT_1135495 [Leucogyrophana mollusca]
MPDERRRRPQESHEPSDEEFGSAGLPEDDDVADIKGSDIDDNINHEGAKRPHIESDDHSNDEDSLKEEVAAVRASAGHDRPKAAAYESNVRAVLKLAIEIYRGLLLTENPYPDDPQEADWSRTVWRQACENLGFRITHTPELLKLITYRASHLCGELNTKSKPIVANVYGFETSADEDIQEANRKLVTELKADNAFVYREHGDSEDEHKGIYANKGIQQVINETLFKNKHDEGITWLAFYSPFPMVGLALVLTAMEFAFTEEEYKSVFKAHLQSLEDFDEHSKEYQLVPKLLQRIHDSRRVHAKAEVVGMASSCVMSKRAFDNAIREAIDNQ